MNALDDKAAGVTERGLHARRFGVDQLYLAASALEVARRAHPDDAGPDDRNVPL